MTQTALHHYSRDKQSEFLDKIIECLRDTLKTCSSSFHHALLQLELAKLLLVRFLELRVDDDHQEAEKVLDVIISPHSHQAIRGEYRFEAPTLKSALGFARSIVYSKSDDWKEAVSRCRSFLDDCSLFGDLLHPVITELLATHAERVYKHFQDSPLQCTQATDLELDLLSFAHSGTSSDEIVEFNVQTVPPLTVVEEKIKYLQRLRSTTLPGTETQRKCLKDLEYCYNIQACLTKDEAAMEDAMEDARDCRRMLLTTTHLADKSKFVHLFAFGGHLFEVFRRTQRFEYLDESITHHREFLRLENARLFHFNAINRLIEIFSIRWRSFSRRSDLDETMELFEQGVGDTQARAPSRLELACRWVDAARASEHHSLPVAYEQAMSLMQSSLVFAPTLPTQHNRLVEKRDIYEKTPLDFASYQIDADRLERAIEVLEQGGALLWSEMRGFRTSTDRLRAANPDMAEEFTAINQELDTLTTSILSNGSVATVDGASIDELIGQLSGLMKRQYELFTKRNALILQIRDQLVGFEDFLLPLPFDTLRSAALHGPVIVINHSKWRSDVIIVLHKDPPSLIPMPSDFFDRASQLKAIFLSTREEYGPDSGHEDALLVTFVLAELYKLIGQQVIEKLKELGIREKSRVWWCPTSALWYLPLHAMGPILSDSGESEDPRYFSDLFISSYTPTLSALLASREPATQPSDPSPPGAWSDAQVIRDLDLQATSLCQGNAILTTALSGLQHHQFVFIAYNGELKTGRPFEASIQFPNGENLTLLDFVRSQHPAGKFALLLGSRTAELTEESLPDEVLHLCAAVQYSGYRSVIGTLCGMGGSVDDGQELAKAVLLSMFSESGNGGEPYYERSARALQDAVQQMRSNLPSVRWVGYVHYGV